MFPRSNEKPRAPVKTNVNAHEENANREHPSDITFNDQLRIRSASSWKDLEAVVTPRTDEPSHKLHRNKMMKKHRCSRGFTWAGDRMAQSGGRNIQ